MPASSVYSTSGGSKATDLAIQVARDIANREVSSLIRTETIKKDDRARIKGEYNRIYTQEYYKWYSIFQSQVEPSFDSPSPNKKFHHKHTVVSFSRTNQIILVRGETVAFSKLNYPIDDKDLSPETGEAYLSLWQGPLDRLYPQFDSHSDSELKRKKITDYISTLLQRDSLRRIKYSNNVDDQRKVILDILTELLKRNGRIDGPGFTSILLEKSQYQLGLDENDRKPLDIIQKILLLGKRVEAARFAESKYLWDHAMFLSFLDDSQPPKRDGSFVKVLERFTNSVDHKTLKTVYQSLLYRTLKTGSVKPCVDNDSHMFAILNANDCDMDFDQANEKFKLIVASRRCYEDHLIKLGYPILETLDPRDDISNLSHTSFSQGDTYTSRISMISNIIDMLILNEIWEYCLNLAKGEDNYIYIINLIPYKLIFASRLLDYGLHDMFESYLNSLRSAMVRVNAIPEEFRDPSYDWDEIGRCVDYLGGVWEIYRPRPLPQSNPSPPHSISPESKPDLHQLLEPAIDFNPESTQGNLQPDFSPYPLDKPRLSFQQGVLDYGPLEVTQPKEILESFPEQTSTRAPLYAPPPPPPNIDESNASRNSIADIPTSPIQPVSPPSNDYSGMSSISPIRENSSHQQQPQQQGNNSQSGQTFSLDRIFDTTVGRFLPKSNSKEIKLPDDTKKDIIYDREKGRWHDTANPNDDDIDAMDGPPPVMNTSTLNQPNNQWTSTKSAKHRYPPPSFNRN